LIVHSILVVDDEAQIRDLLNRWLTDGGYDVREADSAERALALMAERAAAVVMCDIEMPGQGGVWLAEQLRERHPTSAMILATALDTIPPATSFKPGIVEYLVKPFQRDGVLQAVSAALEWHASATQRLLEPPPVRESMSSWLDSSIEGPRTGPGA
jgi:DNA-binding NtrC family response regulator